MKILIATGIYPPDIGGPATYVKKLASDFGKKGIEVKVVTYGKPLESMFSKKSSRLFIISKKWPKGLRHILYFWKLLRLTRESDIIYAQNSTSVGLPVLLASKLLCKKFVLKIVGDAAWERYCQWNKEKPDNLERFQKEHYDLITEFLRRIQILVAKNAQKIITPSFYLKNIISGWGIPERKIEVIYNAVEEASDTLPLKEEAKRKIGISGNIILSVGRLTPWKGFSTLIEIMPDLLEKNPYFKLIIVGSGEEEIHLKDTVAQLELADSVKLVGRVPHQKIPLYFRAADIFVLNSWYEGLSHVILEAMQFGVPIIASNKGGNPELIENKINGFLVGYNNEEEIKGAILKLWQDKNLQEKFIKNSKEKLKKFNWDNLVEQTLKVLTNL